MYRPKATCVAAALALLITPAAAAGDYLTVGYRTPADLHGLTVLRQIPQLHAAQVPAREARAAASRPGLRVLGRVVGRVRSSEPALNPLPTGALEWQYVATRSDLVPEWVQRAASTVTIAVVDTGADLSAPDLAAKAPIAHSVVTGRDESRDTVGHGTFVASLAAGSITNGDGLAGFGGDAQLMVVQANLAGATFTDVDEAVAIVWAVDHGARIVNLSLSGGTTSRVERAAIKYASDRGALLVAASGNEGASGNPVQYPAALLGANGLAVGASTTTGSRAPFSSFGKYVSLAAPGVNVLGAVSADAAPTLFSRVTLPGATGFYGLGSGTSYSAPQVSGAAALVWAANPTLTAQQVAATLTASATGGGHWTPQLGWGVVDVAAAVARAGSPAAAVPAAAPTPRAKSATRRAARR